MNPERTLQLVDNHRQFLAFLERRLGDRALAEDILQDAFVKSLEKPVEVRDETSSVAWFYRTLRDAVIDHYRRIGTRSRALEALARAKSEFHRKLLDCLPACFAHVPELKRMECALPSSGRRRLLRARIPRPEFAALNAA